ncbi:MAG TPA: polyprenol monophosphomannose synthase [bacterium]|nr:polyprenol monophosphomannose synthase [bacterium]
MNIYIVIPTYNEKENIEKLVREICRQPINGLRILIVDDDSPDGTGKKADKLAAELPVDVLHREKKQGLGVAYRAGFKYALQKGADFIFEMDADFSHQPQDLSRLLLECQNGAALAIGSRKVKGGQIIGWNFKRKLYSNGAMWLAKILLGLKTRDLTAGFRCFRAETLTKIDYENISSNGYAFQVETVYRLEMAGLKIVEVPVVFPDRELGKSKLNKRDITEFFRKVFKLFWYRICKK